MARKASKPSSLMHPHWIVFIVIAVFTIGTVVYVGHESGYLGARTFSVATTPTPPPVGAAFNCSPRQQTVYANQQVTIIEDPSGLQWSTRWAAPGGRTASGGPSLSFQTTYTTPGDYTVTATSLSGFPGGSKTDTCQVKIVPSPTPTPGPGATAWQNPRNRCDVNDDGYVTPQDILVVTNSINRSGTRDLRQAKEPAAPPYIDVNGDNYLNSFDAQAVRQCVG